MAKDRESVCALNINAVTKRVNAGIEDALAELARRAGAGPAISNGSKPPSLLESGRAGTTIPTVGSRFTAPSPTGFGSGELAGTSALRAAFRVLPIRYR
jgi:hypothetical protein